MFPRVREKSVLCISTGGKEANSTGSHWTECTPVRVSWRGQLAADIKMFWGGFVLHILLRLYTQVAYFHTYIC